MFVRLMVVLGVVAALTTGVSKVGTENVKNVMLERIDSASLSVLDNALVTYHSAHGYTLPQSLTEQVLEDMGVKGIDLSKYEYRKVNNNKFELACNLNNSGRMSNSFHSGVTLPTQGFNSEFDSMNAGNLDGDESDIDVSAKSVFIGDDVMIHGSVKVGEGYYGDGRHTFTHNYEIGPAANVNSDQVNIADNTSIGSNANIRNFVEIIGDNISIGDRVTLWSEATVGDNVNIANADAGEIIFQTAVPGGTTLRRTGIGSGNLTFYSGSTVGGGTNEIYNESAGNINIYTKFPKDTTLKRLGTGKGDITYFINSTIGGSHTIRNDSAGAIDLYCDVAEGTNFTRGGTGTSKLVFEEMAQLKNNCQIYSDNSGKISVSGLLDNCTFRYTGGGSGSVTFSNIASLEGTSEIYSENSGSVNFAGKMLDGAFIKYTGKGSGTLDIITSATVEGKSEIYNESSGPIRFDKTLIPDGTVIKNYSKYGGIYLYGAGSGYITIEPGVEFIVENLSNTSASVDNWSNLRLKSGKVTIKGTTNAGIILNSGFGGHFVIQPEGSSTLYMGIAKYDWNGQTVRYKINNIRAWPEKHLHIYTGNLGSFTDVEAFVSVCLYGSYADNTKIKISGDSDFGCVYFYGNYSGNINLSYTGSSGSYISFYNDMSNLEGLSFIAPNAGNLYVNTGVVLGKNITINNNSEYRVTIAKNVVIGDGVTINVSENYPSNVTISDNVPANTVLNY